MKKIMFLTVALVVSLILAACSVGANRKPESPLNPDKPVTVILWHYYSGHNKEKFDMLVNEFNETAGVELGIVVESQSQGDVQQLADAVFASANKGLGAAPMPDIFAAYADNAFRVNQVHPIVSLDKYFTSEELAQYRLEFLEEGNFLNDGKYRIMPVAKSTENLYLNKTIWDQFAAETGADIRRLSTWEGLAETAEKYHQHTGKSFFGIDAYANFMIVGAVQNGQEIYNYDSQTQEVTLNFKKDYAQKIWDAIYVPYMKGYFAKEGRFSSDDAKTGTIIAYTGSTAGAAYFPKEVTFSEDNVVPIEPLTLPYPYFEDGSPYVIQQGAGMCISESDLVHEYAAAEFLKWFTQPKQNLFFAVSTGYLPVTNEALEEDVLLSYLDEAGINLPGIVSSVQTTAQMLKTYNFYNNKPFNGSFEMRSLMEKYLVKKMDKEDEMDFEKWYQDFISESEKILK